jgi:hypothetical protein
MYPRPGQARDLAKPQGGLEEKTDEELKTNQHVRWIEKQQKRR